MYACVCVCVCVRVSVCVRACVSLYSTVDVNNEYHKAEREEAIPQYCSV